jgi:hypothetical protein
MPFDQMIVTGPFKGIVDNLPRPYKPKNAWDDVLNFITHEGRIQTRPRLNTYGNPPDGAVLRNAITFNDIQGSKHTLALTTKTPYFITTGPVYNALSTPGSISLAGTSLPYGMAAINGQIFFSNGSVVGLYADGEASVKDSGHPGSWRFAGVLSNHVVTCLTTEPEPGAVGSIIFNARVRWSNNGDGTDWAEGPGSTAGHTDLLEVPDFITGFSTLGRSGYIFRPNGITLMTATGDSTAPFEFDQVSNALAGVGCKYPYTLCTYGNLSAFVAANDLYAFDGTTLTPFGGEAKHQIFRDIASSTTDVISANIIAVLGPSLEFLSYWLSIPGVSTWVYSYDDQNWVRFSSSAGSLTALSSVVGG